VDKNRVTLLNVAKEARDAGEISAIEFLRVRRVCQPRVWNRMDADAKATIGQQIESFVAEHGVKAGKIAGDKLAADVDWDAILAFIKELLPVILEFIQALIVLF
jgi:hypothetical protein